MADSFKSCSGLILKLEYLPLMSSTMGWWFVTSRYLLGRDGINSPFINITCIWLPSSWLEMNVMRQPGMGLINIGSMTSLWLVIALVILTDQGTDRQPSFPV